MCRIRPFLAVLRSFFHSSLLCNFSCHPSPPTILPSYLTSPCHLFLGLPLNLVVPKFIYNTLLGILFPSTLCTCPNQHIQFYFLPLSVHVQTNTHNSISFHSVYMSKPTHTILVPSTLCTCPNQHKQFCYLPLSVHVQTNTYNSVSFHSVYMSKAT
jgi:hypothetical protein